MKKLGALKITASIILVSTAVFCVCRTVRIFAVAGLSMAYIKEESRSKPVSKSVQYLFPLQESGILHSMELQGGTYHPII